MNPTQAKNILGQTFGRLSVLCRAPNDKYGNACWACKCACGNEVVAVGFKLRNGHVKSCGCYSAELVRTRSTTHGDSSSRLFKIWSGIKTRCSNSSISQWHNYGGRGISLCEEWLSYEAFKEWAMKNGYEESLTIDRKNVNGNYEPGNCRWATVLEQAKNRTTCFLPDGRRKDETAKKLGISMGTIRSRLREGWPEEAAYSTPNKRPFRKYPKKSTPSA